MSHTLGVGRRAALHAARRIRSASSAAAASAVGSMRSSSASSAAAAGATARQQLPGTATTSAAATYSSLSGRSILSSPSLSVESTTPNSSRKQIRHLSTDDLPYHLVVGMPALSPTMEAGTIAEWNVKEGEAFAAGDSVAEIETDKATIAFEAQDDGYVAKILVEAGSGEIPVGTPVMVTVEEEEDIAAFKDFVAPEAAAAAAAPAGGGDAAEEAPAAAAATAAAPATTATAAPARDVPPEFALMPSARSISQSAGVDATVLEGTGKGGRVTKGDVLKALKDGVYMPPLAAKAADAAPAAQAAAAAPAAPAAAATPIVVTIPPITTDSTYEDVPNNNMRKVIAKRLTESKSQVPHFYTTVQIELDAALALRKQLASNHDVKVSVNDLVIRSAALALRDVPEVNVTYNPKTNTVSTHDTVDISVAVATPTGLITPIVPQTSTLGLSEISASVKDLATRARDGKLAPEEYQGGTFCISNLGMFGITEFSAVINPPQAAILAVGGGVKTVVPGKWIDDEEKNASDAKRRPTVKTLMTARLSADRRVVDEATAALFLSSLNKYLAKPELLML